MHKCKDAFLCCIYIRTCIEQKYVCTCIREKKWRKMDILSLSMPAFTQGNAIFSLVSDGNNTSSSLANHESLPLRGHWGLLGVFLISELSEWPYPTTIASWD